MIQNRPSSGSMVWWRFQGEKAYRFGYVTYVGGCNMLRMGAYNGDEQGGVVASIADIEWRRR